MRAEQNKAALLRLFSELQSGNTNVIDDLCSPNFAFYSPNFPNWPRGLEGARAIATMGPTLFSDSQSTIEDVFAAEDKVVVRWTIRGTYIGEPRPGFPAPGSVSRWEQWQFIVSSKEKSWTTGASRSLARQRTTRGVEAYPPQIIRK